MSSLQNCYMDERVNICRVLRRSRIEAEVSNFRELFLDPLRILGGLKKGP